MRQLTIPESMAMCDWQIAHLQDVPFVEWTGEEYRVYRILFDGSESEGCGQSLDEAYLNAGMFPQITLPDDVTDATEFPNIAEAIEWSRNHD